VINLIDLEAGAHNTHLVARSVVWPETVDALAKHNDRLGESALEMAIDAIPNRPQWRGTVTSLTDSKTPWREGSADKRSPSAQFRGRDTGRVLAESAV
jgi:hypothetical protein